MIKVTNLTKRYAGHTAVQDLCFEVARGEIVGFLGPNGAGKTTTMRILTGYLPATGGEVYIAGHDVVTESLEVRRNIGYLPEHNALYTEMRVQEYLRYRGKLKGLGRKRLRIRVDDVCEQCGLEHMRRRIIGHLSKGYRQRVGLADALVHEPELLILDEPTIGLDPNQIRQMRDLIRNLASRHTVLLSTHILSEVEAVCQRVLILHQGRIVASDTPSNLKDLLVSGDRILAEVRAPVAELASELRALPGVAHVEASGNGPWINAEIAVAESAVGDLRPAIFDLVVRHGWSLRELRLRDRSLEEVFAELTREEDEETTDS